VINCRPGTRISFELVSGYPLKIHNSTITVIESCWSRRHLANNQTTFTDRSISDTLHYMQSNPVSQSDDNHAAYA